MILIYFEPSNFLFQREIYQVLMKINNYNLKNKTFTAAPGLSIVTTATPPSLISIDVCLAVENTKKINVLKFLVCPDLLSTFCHLNAMAFSC